MTARSRLAAATIGAALVLAACGDDDAGTAATTSASASTEVAAPATTAPTTEVAAPATTDGPTGEPDDEHGGHETAETVDVTQGGGVDPELLVPAYLGAAPFQDVSVAEAAGWVNTAETLGCFQDAERGGMGVHWLDESLLDAELDPASPEALVYELDVNGEVVGLVAHEYLVPFEAWTAESPPTLFGLDFHEHPVLPFWILHAYLWKDNPSGMFSDFNPAVRMCPEGVGVFGVDLP